MIGDWRIEWKCGKCDKGYSTDDFLKLSKVLVDPKRPECGYTPVCTCGYTFHLDKWMKKDYVNVYRRFFGIPIWVGKIEVSTVFLEISHFGYWFETMLFCKKKLFVPIECHYADRYITKSEAIQGHNKVKYLLQDKKYKITLGMDYRNRPINTLEVKQ